MITLTDSATGIFVTIPDDATRDECDAAFSTLAMLIFDKKYPNRFGHLLRRKRQAATGGPELSVDEQQQLVDLQAIGL